MYLGFRASYLGCRTVCLAPTMTPSKTERQTRYKTSTYCTAHTYNNTAAYGTRRRRNEGRQTQHQLSQPLSAWRPWPLRSINIGAGKKACFACLVRSWPLLQPASRRQRAGRQKQPVNGAGNATDRPTRRPPVVLVSRRAQQSRRRPKTPRF